MENPFGYDLITFDKDSARHFDMGETAKKSGLKCRRAYFDKGNIVYEFNAPKLHLKAKDQNPIKLFNNNGDIIVQARTQSDMSDWLIHNDFKLNVPSNQGFELKPATKANISREFSSQSTEIMSGGVSPQSSLRTIINVQNKFGTDFQLERTQIHSKSSLTSAKKRRNRLKFD